MKEFFLPGDTFAPRIPCGFSFIDDEWKKVGNAERIQVEMYEGIASISSAWVRSGTLWRETSGALWCRAGGRQYRITHSAIDRRFYAARILPTSPHRECITYELGDRPPCVPLCA
jgi:hypothetical protein